MNKMAINVVLVTALTAGATTASAQLSNGDVLTIGAGSDFRMGSPAATPTFMFGENNITVGAADGDTGTGSHGGAPLPTDVGAVTQPWLFFGNTGYDYVSVGRPVLETAPGQLDFTGWTVTWNGIPAIVMGGCFLVTGGCDLDGDGIDDVSDTGIATLNWSGVYGDPYTLDYTAHVPAGDPSNFGGVEYFLHLEGIVVAGGSVVTLPDEATTIAANPVVIDVLANDSSPDGLEPASVTVVVAASNGSTDDTNPDGTITYTPNTAPDFVGTDSFEYTVDNSLGTTSASTLVTVDVQTNVAPVAADDVLEVSSAVLEGSPQTVSILANDSDANNVPGLPGGIDPAAVTIVTQATTGSCVANADGTITYSQTAPVVGGQFSCAYKVSDIDSVNAPLESNIATLDITVTVTTSDWPSALDPDIIPILFIESGVPGDPVDSSVPAQSGSFFTMQVTPQTLIYTVLEPGPDGGVVIGHDQPAGNTHTGAPTGDEEVSVDQPWLFFANTGLHFTRNGGVTGNPDGTLQFGSLTGGAGKWIVSWNGIPEIDLGGDTTGTFPEDLGFGTIACSPAPCADQSTFELDYAAHVPPGDPSGFGGVPYTLKLVGVVGFLDGTLKTSNGIVSAQTRLAAGDVASTDPDSEVTLQCSGDCFDYTIDNVTDSRVSIVLPLAGGVPLNPVWRILDNGVWRSFDTTAGDTIKSAPFLPGETVCPDPGDAAYGDLTTGHQCIELAIADNGLNDLDPTVGIIRDPSGMGSGGTAGGGSEFVDTRGSDTSGCTILNNQAGPLQRSDWWVLALFIALLGWHRGRSRLQR